MKVHYINILLFALPLNILVGSPHKNPSITPNFPPNTRLLCECELYSPANYDSDPEMKRVMQQFVDRTTQRFHEYDERMKTTRQKCKDKCDKEIQKIILKDKLEKQMVEQFSTLQTDIQSDSIPTCVCEKSLADKTEKFCLNCGVQLGGGVLQASGLLGGIGQLGLDAWKTAALVTAKELAEKAGAAAGLKAGNTHGMYIVTLGLKKLKVDTLESGIYKTFVTTRHYTEVTGLVDIIHAEMDASCNSFSAIANTPICDVRVKLGQVANFGEAKVELIGAIRRVLNDALGKATSSAKAQAARVTAAKKAAILETSTKAIETTSYNCYTTIAYSITAILIIVLIMVIIYLILRYRRKKKMKKKLQYIKLLEE